MGPRKTENSDGTQPTELPCLPHQQCEGCTLVFYDLQKWQEVVQKWGTTVWAQRLEAALHGPLITAGRGLQRL